MVMNTSNSATLQPRDKVRVLEQLHWLDKVLVALGCGCLLGLSTPGFDLWYLSWFGLVPALVLIASCKSKWQATAVGLVFGLGYHLVALWWILGLYPLPWLGVSNWLAFQSVILVWLAESLHQSILMAGFALFAYVLPTRAGLLPHYARPYFPYLLTLPVIWLFLHWVVGPAEYFAGMPVNQLAYSQSCFIELIQIAKLGGSQLVECLLLLSNCALAALIIERSGWVTPLAARVDPISPRVGAFVDLALVATLILLATVWGGSEVAVRPAGITATAVPVELAVIQGNIGAEDELSGLMSASEIVHRYTSLIDKLGVSILVLPEGVAKTTTGALWGALRTVAREQKKEAIVGTVEPVEGGAVNAVRIITGCGQENHVYVQRRLVPFNQFVAGLLSIIGLPKSIWQCAGGGLISTRQLSCPASIWGKVGASVSAELLYPHLVADEVRHGASLLVALVNLSWFHNAGVNRQIVAAAVMRAVENGRFLVLATNTGISAVIYPSGFVSSASAPGHPGVLVDTVQFLYQKTPFTRMWWL